MPHYRYCSRVLSSSFIITSIICAGRSPRRGSPAPARRRPPRSGARPRGCAPVWRHYGSATSRASSPKLVPAPRFLPPGCSLFSCLSQCSLSPGKILKLGVGITFWVPIKPSTWRQLIHNSPITLRPRRSESAPTGRMSTAGFL